MSSATLVPLMTELDRLLGRERRLLVRVLLSSTSGETERVMQRLRSAELYRAMVVHELVADLAVPDEALTLRALVAASVEPYRTTLAGHRRALLELAGATGLTAADADLRLPSLVEWLRP
jgi:hypothetical protein